MCNSRTSQSPPATAASLTSTKFTSAAPTCAFSSSLTCSVTRPCSAVEMYVGVVSVWPEVVLRSAARGPVVGEAGRKATMPLRSASRVLVVVKAGRKARREARIVLQIAPRVLVVGKAVRKAKKEAKLVL